ncbi:MAG: NUDIX domain-containing protein [Chitinophagales bacterium]|nr:NUDIX domain-containing protein [Chitinophagales bacterium]MDW8418572.1 NUDIX domain-containing protein [Chitinophagales bacterium]
MELKRFNVRVYGLLINDNNEILVADEAFKSGMKATKFPGGGLHLGEGPVEGLIREFKEECGINIHVVRHFYTTDFLVRSAFEHNSDSQIISIYYLVNSEEWRNIPVSTTKFDFEYIPGVEAESFRWVKLSELKNEETITLPTDVAVVKLLTASQPAL